MCPTAEMEDGEIFHIEGNVACSSVFKTTENIHMQAEGNEAVIEALDGQKGLVALFADARGSVNGDSKLHTKADPNNIIKIFPRE